MKFYEELKEFFKELKEECSESVRVALLGDRKNRAKGFYLLMTNCNTFSDVKNEVIVERNVVKLLRKNKIDYKVKEI